MILGKKMGLPSSVAAVLGRDFVLCTAAHQRLATLEPADRKRVGEIPSSWKSEMDTDLAGIPEGFFLMGSESGQDNERPIHRVWVDAFLLARSSSHKFRLFEIRGCV